jgi:hypothetical protein
MKKNNEYVKYVFQQIFLFDIPFILNNCVKTWNWTLRYIKEPIIYNKTLVTFYTSEFTISHIIHFQIYQYTCIKNIDNFILPLRIVQSESVKNLKICANILHVWIGQSKSVKNLKNHILHLRLSNPSNSKRFIV